MSYFGAQIFPVVWPASPYLCGTWLPSVQTALQSILLCWTWLPSVQTSLQSILPQYASPYFCVSCLLCIQIGSRSLALQDTLMRPGHVLNGFADVLRGLISAPTEQVDEFFVEGVNHHMFETNADAMDGLDLVSRKSISL